MLTGRGSGPTPVSQHHCGLETSTTPYCLALALDSISQKPAAVSQCPPSRWQACCSDCPAAAALALDSYSQTLTSLTHQPWFLMQSWRFLSTAGSLACARSVPAGSAAERVVDPIIATRDVAATTAAPRL